jgi:hypothetical protein
MLQEVACGGANIQVARADVLPLVLHKIRRGAAPHPPGVHAEDQDGDSS